jgi:hypothetical protein
MPRRGFLFSDLTQYTIEGKNGCPLLRPYTVPLVITSAWKPELAQSDRWRWTISFHSLFLLIKTRNTKQFFCFEKMISNTSYFFTKIIIILFLLCCKFSVLCFSGYHQYSVLYIPIIKNWYQSILWSLKRLWVKHERLVRLNQIIFLWKDCEWNTRD